MVLVFSADDANIRISYNDEEVWSGLPTGWLVTHVGEVLASERSWTVVDHPTFVDDTNFAEEVIQVLGCLVNRHRSCYFSNVGGNAKDLDKIERGSAANCIRNTVIGLFGEGCILVPAVDQTSTR